MLAIQLMLYSNSLHDQTTFGEVAVGVIDPSHDGTINVFFHQHNPRIIPINAEKNKDTSTKVIH